jgi:hypothetical protein
MECEDWRGRKQMRVGGDDPGMSLIDAWILGRPITSRDRKVEAKVVRF